MKPDCDNPKCGQPVLRPGGVDEETGHATGVPVDPVDVTLDEKGNKHCACAHCGKHWVERAPKPESESKQLLTTKQWGNRE